LGRKPVSGRFDANFHAYPYLFLCAQRMAEAFFRGREGGLTCRIGSGKNDGSSIRDHPQ
jgi:hypothetical protein